MFGAMLFAVKSGNYKEHEKYGDMFVDSELSKKYSKWESVYKLYSLKSWIVTGAWNALDFREEINVKFNIQDMSDEEKFIRYIFWDLDQNLINNGIQEMKQRIM